MKSEKQSVFRNGGKRSGAGRKPGIANKATQARQAEVAETGVTPLEVMLYNMRSAHAAGLAIDKKLARTKDEAAMAILMVQRRAAREESQRCAKQAADFIHPKLQSVMHAQDPDNVQRVIHSVDRESLERAARFIRGGVYSEPQVVVIG